MRNKKLQGQAIFDVERKHHGLKSCENGKRSPVKKISPKGKRKLSFAPKKPGLLCGKKFFLDLHGSGKGTSVKDIIEQLGGTLEEFNSKEVHYIITNRFTIDEIIQHRCQNRQGTPSPLPGPVPSPLFAPVPSPLQQISSNKGAVNSPLSTDSPQTQQSFDQKNLNTTRGRSLLSKAVSTTQKRGSSNLLQLAQKWGTKVLHLEQFLKWSKEKKVAACLQARGRKTGPLSTSATHGKSSTFRVKNLKSPFIKVEDVSRNYRPFFSELEEWPVIHFESASGSCPFEKPVERSISVEANDQISDKETNKDDSSQTMSERASEKLEDRQPEKRLPQKEEKEDIRCGYCECCSVRFNDVSKHLKSDQHRAFARNDDNYAKLDAIIQRGNSFQHFLTKVHKKYSETVGKDGAGEKSCSANSVLERKNFLTTSMVDKPLTPNTPDAFIKPDGQKETIGNQQEQETEAVNNLGLKSYALYYDHVNEGKSSNDHLQEKKKADVKDSEFTDIPTSIKETCLVPVQTKLQSLPTNACNDIIAQDVSRKVTADTKGRDEAESSLEKNAKESCEDKDNFDVKKSFEKDFLPKKNKKIREDVNVAVSKKGSNSGGKAHEEENFSTLACNEKVDFESNKVTENSEARATESQNATSKLPPMQYDQEAKETCADQDENKIEISVNRDLRKDQGCYELSENQSPIRKLRSGRYSVAMKASIKNEICSAIEKEKVTISKERSDLSNRSANDVVYLKRKRGKLRCSKDVSNLDNPYVGHLSGCKGDKIKIECDTSVNEVSQGGLKTALEKQNIDTRFNAHLDLGNAHDLHISGSKADGECSVRFKGQSLATKIESGRSDACKRDEVTLRKRAMKDRVKQCNPENGSSESSSSEDSSTESYESPSNSKKQRAAISERDEGFSGSSTSEAENSNASISSANATFGDTSLDLKAVMSKSQLEGEGKDTSFVDDKIESMSVVDIADKTRLTEGCSSVKDQSSPSRRGSYEKVNSDVTSFKEINSNKLPHVCQTPEKSGNSPLLINSLIDKNSALSTKVTLLDFAADTVDDSFESLKRLKDDNFLEKTRKNRSVHSVDISLRPALASDTAVSDVQAGDVLNTTEEEVSNLFVQQQNPTTVDITYSPISNRERKNQVKEINTSPVDRIKRQSNTSCNVVSLLSSPTSENDFKNQVDNILFGLTLSAEKQLRQTVCNDALNDNQKCKKSLEKSLDQTAKQECEERGNVKENSVCTVIKRDNAQSEVTEEHKAINIDEHENDDVFMDENDDNQDSSYMEVSNRTARKLTSKMLLSSPSDLGLAPCEGNADDDAGITRSDFSCAIENQNVMKARPVKSLLKCNLLKSDSSLLDDVNMFLDEDFKKGITMHERLKNRKRGASYTSSYSYVASASTYSKSPKRREQETSYQRKIKKSSKKQPISQESCRNYVGKKGAVSDKQARSFRNDRDSLNEKGCSIRDESSKFSKPEEHGRLTRKRGGNFESASRAKGAVDCTLTNESPQISHEDAGKENSSISQGIEPSYTSISCPADTPENSPSPERKLRSHQHDVPSQKSADNSLSLKLTNSSAFESPDTNSTAQAKFSVSCALHSGRKQKRHSTPAPRKTRKDYRDATPRRNLSSFGRNLNYVLPHDAFMYMEDPYDFIDP